MIRDVRFTVSSLLLDRPKDQNPLHVAAKAGHRLTLERLIDSIKLDREVAQSILNARDAVSRRLL